MGRILIDPPVGPYDPPEAVREWVASLRERRSQTTDAGEQRDYDDAIALAEGWLEGPAA